MIHALYSYKTAALKDPVRLSLAKGQEELLSRGKGSSLGVGHPKIKAPAHPGWRLSVGLTIKSYLVKTYCYEIARIIKCKNKRQRGIFEVTHGTRVDFLFVLYLTPIFSNSDYNASNERIVSE
jgi:hypothetical protein